MLLHAGGMSWRLWTPVLPALVAHREVFAPTMPGHLGGPPWPNGRLLTFAVLADAVERQLDQLGFECLDVVGNSVGGGVAFELARRGRARRVVAIGPMGMQTDAQARRLAAIIPRTHRAARLSRPALLPALALADRIATLDQMRRYLDALPNAQLTELAGAGHFAQVDQPERVAQLILDFTG